MAVFTEDQKSGILQLREYLEGYENWAVAAGCAATEYGYPKTPNDIDIILTKKGLTRVHRLLKMMVPSRIIDHEKPEKYLGFRVDLLGANITFFADAVFDVEEGRFVYSADQEMYKHTRRIMVKERDFVPVISPEDTLVFYALRQNSAKNDMVRIKHILAKQKVSKELLLQRVQKIGQEKAYERAAKVLPI